MDERDGLTRPFEEHRGHLRAVAYRMLGSMSEAEDAVQEAWLRLNRSDTTDVDNLKGWLTTVVARVCLDTLRSRKSRREQPLETEIVEPAAPPDTGIDPEREALLADSVGLALLVVLDTLSPPERLAFVLHDMFAMPFDEIGTIVGRTPTAARQLASRGRRRVQGVQVPREELTRQRAVVDAFIDALRKGDFEGLIAVLDPDVRVHIDEASTGDGRPRDIRGARAWAQGAMAFRRYSRFTQAALIDGEVGIVYAPGGRLSRVLRFTFRDDKIVQAEIIGDSTRLRELTLATVPT